MTPVAQMVREVVKAPLTALSEERMKSGVYRVHCSVDGNTRSFIGKRLDPDIGRRNELVARRWLPAAGLGDAGPPLLGTAAEPDASFVWHLYEDLGDCALDPATAGAERVGMAVAAIARIHTRFAGHVLTPEFRNWGGDFGMHFYTASVRDATTAIESLLARTQEHEQEHAALCERLLARLAELEDGEPRADALARHGGRETLLHGDLWPMNVMLQTTPAGDHVRFIDWDHAGVGPVSYDLSTFLSRFPHAERPAILHVYEEQVAAVGWQLPGAAELNALFETAELARIANRVIWPALAACEDGAAWAYAELEEVERWFEQLAPMLPAGDACAQS